jgi:hypothetical protein
MLYYAVLCTRCVACSFNIGIGRKLEGLVGMGGGGTEASQQNRLSTGGNVKWHTTECLSHCARCAGTTAESLEDPSHWLKALLKAGLLACTTRPWLHSDIHYAALPGATVPGTQPGQTTPLPDSVCTIPDLYTGCFKKSFTTLKAYINVVRGYVQCFERS